MTRLPNPFLQATRTAPIYLPEEPHPHPAAAGFPPNHKERGLAPGGAAVPGCRGPSCRRYLLAPVAYRLGAGGGVVSGRMPAVRWKGRGKEGWIISEV